MMTQNCYRSFDKDGKMLRVCLLFELRLKCAVSPSRKAQKDKKGKGADDTAEDTGDDRKKNRKINRKLAIPTLTAF